MKWKQNVLWHSFISYHMAMVKDANQMDLGEGSSPYIIFRNYLELDHNPLHNRNKKALYQFKNIVIYKFFSGSN